MATVKIRLKSLAESLGEPNEPETLWINFKTEVLKMSECWTDFKTKVLKVSESCLRDTPGTSNSFLTKETLNIIEESRRARLEGRSGQYREVEREAVCAVRRDEGAQVRGVFETVESHLWSTFSQRVYRGLRTLRTFRPPAEMGTAPRGCGIYAEMLRAGRRCPSVVAHSVVFH